ncbi:MAG: type II toxin-antitoxin system VapC family toxin [Rhodospirillaceae bacterium]|nr:type II toxin-antitoxin system VapC family toxin [Rhodospirillaceae bacterium]
MAVTAATRLLLDTHAFIWWRSAPTRFGPAARQAIAEAETVYVSMASAWEAAIKVSIGKLKLDVPFEDGVTESGFRPLPIGFRHIDHLAALPYFHRDPFDRMLIAQALTDGLTIVTDDRRIANYEVARLPVNA